MKIVQITPGSGDTFYCENCLRDIALVKSVRRLGHDIVMVPLYLPVQNEGGGPVSDVPIFFGGINVFLQQKSVLFRKTPRWVDRWLDSPRLLKWVGRRTGMTSARELAETTLSMLRGENGRQTKELDRLVEWLSLSENRPDIVCLSNVLLAGLARRIKDKLGVPVVCLLQDEDGFVDALGESYARQAWDMLAERAGDIDDFISVSKYFAEVMQRRLRLSSEKLHVVYMGISLDDYKESTSGSDKPTLGFLSRMCYHHGLDVLVDAFIILRRDKTLKDLRLRITGGKTTNDEEFVNQIRDKLASRNLLHDVEFVDDFSRDGRRRFLQGLTVLSVPERQPVAYGLYVLEALAAGVPVVKPAFGVFPEMLGMTGGGVLFEPNNVEALVSALRPLVLDVEYARRLGQQGRQGVLREFDIQKTSQQLVAVFSQIVNRRV
jgi:glycosyltransferase involved in cell wall biosynthesis